MTHKTGREQQRPRLFDLLFRRILSDALFRFLNGIIIMERGKWLQK